MAKARVTIDVEVLGVYLKSMKRRYVTLKDVSRMLGVSTKTAGKLLARLEEAGFARRYSSRAYMLLWE